MTTAILPAKILLIENDPAAAEEIRAALAAAGSGSFDVEWAGQLSDGLERLSKKGIAVVLLELSLPESQGFETFDKLYTAASGIPILGGNGNEAHAKQAVGHGEQDSVDDALYVEKERGTHSVSVVAGDLISTQFTMK